MSPGSAHQRPIIKRETCCVKGSAPWLIHTFFRNFPRMCARRCTPSKHCASRRPLPNILMTCAYSGGVRCQSGAGK